ncbi:hypothetical protein GCM10007094_33900 [Pseudovibrio japonicus]|uniref:Autotransporter domain-containing protein n=1 Tax=Pseudovibrio japonicus TaxID=366534 RepID=A0ABQ3EKU5_9HYPH|nr:autotransporter domain-containing protein [Pseudovibrio japonicus]GHB41654.1 hypothetical protein GCM10007094_33900 [Pseudovibrio japonicus]
MEKEDAATSNQDDPQNAWVRGESKAYDVSADGSVVIGSTYSTGDIYRRAFRRTEDGGMQDLGTLRKNDMSTERTINSGRSEAYGVSADGKVVVGVADTDYNYHYHAFRWTVDGGMESLGTLSVNSFSNSEAYNISDDGSTIVGYSDTGNSWYYHAFRWTEDGGMQDLGTLVTTGDGYSKAYDVSADGSKVVGFANTDESKHAFLWDESTDEMEDLGTLEADPENARVSEAYSISADGSTVVGGSTFDGGTRTNEFRAFRWTRETEMVSLGTLRTDGAGESTAWDVNFDGSVIVGQATTNSGEEQAFRWFEGFGDDGDMEELGTLKSDNTGTSVARSVSDDGTVVVGYSDTDSGETHAFIFKKDLVLADGTRVEVTTPDVIPSDGGSSDDGDPSDGGPTDGEPTDGGPTDGGPTGGEPTDGGPTDGEPTDGGPTDGGPTDGGPTDGDPTDGGPTDGGPTDGGPTDGGPTDGEPTDGGATDGEPTDGGPTDGEPTDGGPTDGGPTDGGPTDGGPTDGEPTDGGPTDGGPTDGEPTDGGPTDGGPTDGEPTDGGPTDGGPTDGGPTDGGPTDGGPTDGGPTDGEPTDGGPTDGGPTDGEPTDGGPTDGGPTDGEPTDGGPTDGGPTDGGPTDGGPTDGGPTDGEPTDGGPTDGGPTDGEPTDGGPTDGGPTDGEPTDGGPTDGGPTDGGPTDGGPTDGGPTDGGPTDGEPTDGDTDDSNTGGISPGGNSSGIQDLDHIQVSVAKTAAEIQQALARTNYWQRELRGNVVRLGSDQQFGFSVGGTGLWQENDGNYAATLASSIRVSDGITFGGSVAVLSDERISDTTERGLGYGFSSYLDLDLLSVGRGQFGLRLDGAYARSTYDIKRGVGLSNVQIGSDDIEIDSAGFGATLRYDFAYSDNTTFSPYAGVYYERTKVSDYTEAHDLDTALYFDSMTYTATVVTAGLNAEHSWGNGFTMYGGVGADVDVYTDGTMLNGAIDLVEDTAVSFDSSEDRRSVRAHALFGLGYDFSPSQRIEWISQIESPTYDNDWTKASKLKYSVTF